jgi:hypothetical protein
MPTSERFDIVSVPFPYTAHPVRAALGQIVG